MYTFRLNGRFPPRDDLRYLVPKITGMREKRDSDGLDELEWKLPTEPGRKLRGNDVEFNQVHPTVQIENATSNKMFIIRSLFPILF